MFAELADIGHFEHSAVTYPYAGLFDGPGDIGMLDLVTLQTSHSHDVP
jgi:hypothetical protein